MPAEYLPAGEARELLRGLVEAAKEQGIKGKAIYQPLRVALSGRDEGPELFYLVGGLGKSTHPGAAGFGRRLRGPFADPTRPREREPCASTTP